MLRFCGPSFDKPVVVPTYSVDGLIFGPEARPMFLRCKTRKKDGKIHRYWSVVENRRVSGGRVVQRQVLYLGEINDGQKAAWRRSIEVFADGEGKPRQLTLFAEGAKAPLPDDTVVHVRLCDLVLARPPKPASRGRFSTHFFGMAIPTARWMALGSLIPTKPRELTGTSPTCTRS